MRGWRALSILTVALAIGAGQAFAGPLSGKIWVHVDPTEPLSAVFVPGVGVEASPNPGSSEIDDALAQFTDPRAAMERLEALKRARGYSGGMVFAGFYYTTEGFNAGKMDLLCGVTRTQRPDFERVREAMTDYRGGDSSGIKWRNFKKSSRAERVRAIARCLGSFEGMPRLRPARHEVRKLYIDDTSYALAEEWIGREDMPAVRGSHEQYRKAFRCLVTRAAEENLEATGESVVFRAMDTTHTIRREKTTPRWMRSVFPGINGNYTEYEEVPDRHVFMSVTSDSNVDYLWSRGDAESVGGLWPTSAGFTGVTVNGMDHPIEQALGPRARSHLAECRRHAGLFELPSARVDVPVPGVACPGRGAP